MDDALETVMYHYVSVKEMGDLILHGVPEKSGYVADPMENWFWIPATQVVAVTYRKVAE